MRINSNNSLPDGRNNNNNIQPLVKKKGTHPRIKYSKHKNPSIVPQSPFNQRGGGNGNESKPETKSVELHNFALSRKFPNDSRISTDYDTSISNTSHSNDMTFPIIDDLDLDDIELPEDINRQYNIHQQYINQRRLEDQMDRSNDTDNMSSMDEKYALLSDTTLMHKFEMSESMMSDSDESSKQHVCRHCGKKYRWKSTLRRHENVECGGKEASHQCPYCQYRAKQKGNLGVHVRKHHPDKPPLETRRKASSRFKHEDDIQI